MIEFECLFLCWEKGISRDRWVEIEVDIGGRKGKVIFI